MMVLLSLLSFVALSGILVFAITGSVAKSVVWALVVGIVDALLAANARWWDDSEYARHRRGERDKKEKPR